LISSTTVSQSKITWVRNVDRLPSTDRKSSLQIVGPNLSDRNNLIAQDVQLQPNKTYTLSFYAKGLVRNKDGIGLQYIMTNPLDKEPLLQFKVHGSSDWQRRSLTFTTPMDYQQGRLDIAWDLEEGDTVWIDDVAICEGKNQCDDGNVILPSIPHITSP
jgi:hypothetical protein